MVIETEPVPAWNTAQTGLWLTRKHIVFTMQVTTLAHAGRKRNMTRLIHVLAALGAALVFGCGAPDETAIQGIESPTWSYGEGELFDGPSFPETHDGVEDKSKFPLLQGWAIKSALQCGPDGFTAATGCHHRPLISSITSPAQFATALTGRCGDPALNYDACIVPSTNGINGKAVSWYWDGASCSSDRGMTDLFLTGIASALDSISVGSGWTFPIASSAATADVVYRCPTSAEAPAMVHVMGKMTPMGGIEPWSVEPEVINEHCDLDNFESDTDAYYKYRKGLILINWGMWTNDYTTKCAPLGFQTTTNAYRTNTATTLAMHEMLHWLGFTHQFDKNNVTSFQNIMYPHAGCYDGETHARTELNTLRPLVVQNLALRDTTVTTSGDATFGIACYLPLEREPNLTLSESAPFVDGNNMGGTVPYTNNYLQGVQTGPAHLRCNWTSASQECTIPGIRRLPYCFDATATAELKTRIRTNLNLPNRSLEGFTFPENGDCNSPDTKIVFAEGTCAGNTNNMDGIVCATFPPNESLRELSKADTTGFNQQGSWYSWTSHGGKVTIKLDRADINTFSTVNAPFDQRSTYEGRALFLAIGWAQGMGTNDVSANYENSRARLPLTKTGGSFSLGQKCMTERLFPDGRHGVAFGPNEYCGQD